MRKVNMFFLFSLFSLSLISAYETIGGSFNDFSFNNFFQNFNTSTLLLAIVFLIVFWVFDKALQKTGLIRNNASRIMISLILSVFTIYGIIKSNLQIEDELFKIGLTQQTLSQVIPWILIFIAILVIWKLGFGRFLMLTGLILIGAALLNLVYHKGTIIAIGVLLFLAGLIFWKRKKKKEKRKEDLNALDLDKRTIFLENERRKKFAYRKGKQFGNYLGKKKYQALEGTKNIGKKIKKGRKFRYKAGMRRNGEKGTRGRYVSRASTERYSRRFGNRKARKRFG